MEKKKIRGKLQKEDEESKKFVEFLLRICECGRVNVKFNLGIIVKQDYLCMPFV